MRIKNVLIMMILFIPFVAHAGELDIINYDNGTYGSSVLLKSNDNYLLMNTGNDNIEQTISWLNRQSITKLDLYLSSYYRDNLQSFFYFLWEGNIKVNKVYLPDISSIRKYLNDESKNSHENAWQEYSRINKFYNRVLDVSRDKGYEVVILKTGDSFKLGDAMVNIIGPTREFTMEELHNYEALYEANSSLVAMVSIDNKKYLHMGEMFYESADDLLAKRVDVKADIMLLSESFLHECESNEFIEAVSPKYVNHFMESGLAVEESLTKDIEYCALKSQIMSMANYYTSDENGTVTFNIKDGVITTKRCDNCSRVDVNYTDKNTKKVLDTYSSYYSSGLPYYLDAPKKEFKNYKYVDDDIEDGDVIRGDRVFTVNYEEIPVVINHKFDNNSDEAKVVMLVQKYVNENLRSKLYLNNLRDWNALSVEYIGDTTEGKEYYLKTAIDCAGDVKCIEDATDFDSNNNQYLYNAYVTVDGNSNVKLSFEKSSLVEDDEEIGEGEVENPKTGSYISLFIILSTFVIVVVISFMVRKNKLYKIN